VYWTINGAFRVDDSRAKLGCPSSDWYAVFLEPAISQAQDWLFFVKRSWTRDKLMGINFQQSGIPESDRRVICTWNDAGPQFPGAQWGLNDCAHFVSECLAAGNMKSVGDPGVPALIKNLQNLPNTKTLVNLGTEAAAARVLKTGLVKRGDIIAYAGDNNQYYPHGHSAIYMGSEAVANHTRFNHPDFKGLEGGRDNWKRYTIAERGHPKVTIVHFSDDDRAPISCLSLDGSWEVTMASQVFYYHFDRSGHVGWTTREPASRTTYAGVPSPNRGHWFETATDQFTICWTHSGNVERFQFTDDNNTKMKGKWNNTTDLMGRKLS
jgi:hypothetical protein